MAVEYAHKVGAVAMIRGVRNARDFDAEITQYYFNHKIKPGIETVVLMPDVHSLYVSSSAINIFNIPTKSFPFFCKRCHFQCIITII